MKNKSKISDKYEGQPAYVKGRYLTFVYVTAAKKKIFIPPGTNFRGNDSVLKEILQLHVNGNSPPVKNTPQRKQQQTNIHK